MLRDFKFLRRDSGKNTDSEEVENLPLNPRDYLVPQISTDPTRPPLNTIQDSFRIPRCISDQEISSSRVNKADRTPTKPKPKYSDTQMPLPTLEKQGPMAKRRFNWSQKHEFPSTNSIFDTNEEVKIVPNMNTPSSARVVGGINSNNSECTSTHSTPTKSVNKPPTSSGFCVPSGRTLLNMGVRLANYAPSPKGTPSPCNPPNAVNSAVVPYFELKEDPSFWMEHNVQVLIRIRPLNIMEKNNFGFSRCLKQESSQSITCIGSSETKFKFDHVACEAIDQETLFRMVGLPMVENCLSGYNSCMFAYGQTGSGKTYTMLGEIEGVDGKPSSNRGMTPRIFEFLFARIKAEEESRRDERLSYNCKCSFLEIYNEQITDLLDPSSTNLMLREDIKTGVYVENLSEFEVHTVGDILQLLTQGSSNRRVAATNMNRESSRSHSVFTCVIESSWEKDSTTNFRFARLNLVDLAGSERQKSSGAEGERLKEAASINKSLSTLGHVIMLLVDVAHGKPRHVPYRDSRLTFLLQDSLGGNSKTMIIANVSPSICSAAETMNTLKFAQRAKLIQNNAVINEDSSGDVISLKNQIQLLKEEISALKHKNVARPLSHEMDKGNNYDENSITKENPLNMLGNEHGVLRVSSKHLKSLESTLTGSLRREQMADISIKQLEAENEQLNRLVSQREEDTRCTKMMLKFREDKILRLESLLSGLIPADDYLLKENHALSAEIELLRARIDKNPEVTRFALENMRLLEKVRQFQELYEEGEREILMSEISELRNQLIFSHGGNSHPNHLDTKVSNHDEDENDMLHKELKRTLYELEETKMNLKYCLDENANIRREVQELHESLIEKTAAVHEHDCGIEVNKEPIFVIPVSSNQQMAMSQRGTERPGCGNLMNHDEGIMRLQLELDILKIILQEERLQRAESVELFKTVNSALWLSNEKVLSVTKEYDDVQESLTNMKLVVEALESQRIELINEIEDLKNSNDHYQEFVKEKELEISRLKVQHRGEGFRNISRCESSERSDSLLEAKMKEMHASLVKAKRLNNCYESNLAFQESNEEEMEEARKQVEGETAEVIVCLQQELSRLQEEVEASKAKEMDSGERLELLQTQMEILEGNLYSRSEENKILAGMLEEKVEQLRVMKEEYTLIASEVEDILYGGNEALADVGEDIDAISCLLPHKQTWISQQFGKIKECILEKDLLVEELNKCLKGAVDRKDEMDYMLRSLRGAVTVMSETHQEECNEKDKEILCLTSDINDKKTTVKELLKSRMSGKEQLEMASSCATAALVIVNRLSELNSSYQDALNNKDLQLKDFQEAIAQKDTVLNNLVIKIDEAYKRNHSLQLELVELVEDCRKVSLQLREEQKKKDALLVTLGVNDDHDIFEIGEKVKELRSGVSSLISCMDKHANKSGTYLEDNSENSMCFPANDESRSSTGASTKQNIKDVAPCSNGNERYGAILSLKQEAECALEGLQVMQVEIERLVADKEKTSVTEKSNKTSIESLVNQVFLLQNVLDNFDVELELRVRNMDSKIGKIEKAVQRSFTSLFQQQELLGAELDDAKSLAAQKIIEASCILEKFDEVQDTMKEADIMVNELMIANEALKLSVRELKTRENDFVSERNILLDEVQSWKSSNKLKDRDHQILEKKYDSDLAIVKTMLLELEEDFSEFRTTAIKEWSSASSNFLSMKSQLHESADSLRGLLEEVWSEIILKDGAVSVLHLCRMGILLETANGLHAENGLLRHGLSESNSVITELREHYFRSRRELEMCSVAKGKLLAEFKKSFDSISSRVGEAGDITLMLNCFEKKIRDLQLQEEKMLQRHNNMGSELAELMNELELSNKETIESILDQEGSLLEKDVQLQNQEAYFMVEVFTKDILLLILSSELDQMCLQKADVEKSCITFLELLEKFKKDIVLKSIDATLSELILVDKESDNENLLEELKMKESSLQASSGHIAELCPQIIMLQNEISLQKKESSRLQFDLGKKDEEVQRLRCLEMDNETLQFQLNSSKAEYDILSLDFDNRGIELDSENHRLRDEISALGHCIASLDVSLSLARLQIEEHKLSDSVFKDCVRLTIQDLERQLGYASSLAEENILLRNEVRDCDIKKSENLRDLNFKILETVNLIKKMEELCCKILNLTAGNSVKVEDMLQGVVRGMESVNTFMGQFESLENQAGQLDSKILSFQMDVSRRDDILSGALFDLSLLQESASSCQDQKHKMEELLSSLCSAEKKFELKSLELDQAVSERQIREARLQEMTAKIAALELDHVNHQHMTTLLSNKNAELLVGAKDALDEKNSLLDKLMEARTKIENLEMEVVEMEMAMVQMSKTTESLKSELDSVTCQRDELDGKFRILTKELEKTRGLAEHNEAIAMEAQAISEFQKVHFNEKEHEVKLLERSIQELECTINVLEQKVDIVKGEAEKQRLQREELELELLGVKEQMQGIKSSDCDMKRCLYEKEKFLQDALRRVQLLEKEITARDNEISKCKAHISELNLHAEAQADEYKQKFKALEIMVEQVKSDCPATTHSTNSSSNKLDKSTTKSKGSGSPFKCIGLGLVQQMKSERDEELSAGRQRIEELEALAASRQKEVFMLKARLATTESMTHDVIRDLLGVKLNMKNYADLMDNQKLDALTDAKHPKAEAEIKEQEVANLKQQINEFITERNGWLEEIQRKQSELMTVNIALEKLRRQEQLLSTENDILKMDNSNHKKRMKDLETEVQKLSGQQNIQQRIHHHSKIKEENNLLRSQNEELSFKLQKTEAILLRVKEELAQFRAANGKTPYIDFDEEQLLHKKLKETEDERVQLAQKLLGLCTKVLQAAGIKPPTSDLTPSVAEEALGQLKNRVLSLEMELQEAKLKNRISDERVRLPELRPQSRGAASSRTDVNYLGRKRTSHTTLFSTLDR